MGKTYYLPPTQTIQQNLNYDEVYSLCSKHGEGYPLVFQSPDELLYVTALLKEKNFINHPVIVFTGTPQQPKVCHSCNHSPIDVINGQKFSLQRV